jgi:hypothetical protein
LVKVIDLFLPYNLISYIDVRGTEKSPPPVQKNNFHFIVKAADHYTKVFIFGYTYNRLYR